MDCPQSVMLLSALLAVLASATNPESCAARHGNSCSATAASKGQKVAEALAAERRSSPEDVPLQLLQREAAREGRGHDGAAAGAALTAQRAGDSGGSVAAPAVRAAERANSSFEAAERANSSFEAAVHAKSSLEVAAPAARTNSSLEASGREATRGNLSRDTCSQFTGGTCWLSDSCDESRSATCDKTTRFCVCPKYTCSNEVGKCELSGSQIVDAVQNGVTGVAEEVSNMASKVPGIADSVGGILNAASGIGNTITGVLGSLTGADQNSCNSRYISTCFFSGCDQELGYTVGCDYGSCQCKEGFCAVNGKCIVDINAMVSSFQKVLSG